MSVAEILDELPKLSPEERQLLFQRLSELRIAEMEETPEMLAAIDEAQAESSETNVSAEDLRRDVIRWAHSK